MFPARHFIAAIEGWKAQLKAVGIAIEQARSGDEELAKAANELKSELDGTTTCVTEGEYFQHLQIFLKARPVLANSSEIFQAFEGWVDTELCDLATVIEWDRAKLLGSTRHGPAGRRVPRRAPSAEGNGSELSSEDEKDWYASDSEPTSASVKTALESRPGTQMSRGILDFLTGGAASFFSSGVGHPLEATPSFSRE